MNDQMALGLLAEIMGWPADDGAIATREYGWLRLMSAVKFDGYSDFRAGARFLESLATWLKQFPLAERPAAYEFVKKRLVYISPPELQRLIEAFLPEIVTPKIRVVAAKEIGVSPYEIWRTANGSEAFRRSLRKTLFVGMSDGSRIDILRRANAGKISQEQVLPMMNIDDAKWHEMAKDLRGDQGAGAKFERIFLIDDFTASGTTFIRQSNGAWKGKLSRFNKLIIDAREKLQDDFPIVENYELNIHHYISSHQARLNLEERLSTAVVSWSEKSFGSVNLSESLLLPESLKLHPDHDKAMLALCDTYYDPELYTRLEKHCKEAGQNDMKLGYANCALPIVLDHNTPNNSISLLWRWARNRSWP